RCLDVGALVVGGNDDGNTPRGLPAAVHNYQTPCLPYAYSSPPCGACAPAPGGGRPCRLPCDLASAGRQGARAPGGTGEKRPGRPSDRSPPRRPRDRPRCLLGARAPFQVQPSPAGAPRRPSPVLDFAVT